MGWFSNPKCPQCGRESTKTGYAAPFPQYQCKPCKRDNAEKQELEDRIKRLEKKLESKQ